MSAYIPAQINFCMPRAGAAKFNPRLCPINIIEPATWVPDRTYNDVIGYSLIVIGF